MKKALLRGGVALVSLVALVSVFTMSALAETPLPPTPPTTDCVACETQQADLASAYSDLDLLISDLSPLMLTTEQLLETGAGDLGGPEDIQLELDGLQTSGQLAYGADCSNPEYPYPYYTIFAFDNADYCFMHADGFNSFFEGMFTVLTGTTVETSWVDLHNSLLTDILIDSVGFEDTDPDDLEDLLLHIDDLLALLLACEETECPVVADECPDCEAIAAQLDTAMDDLVLLEGEADLLDVELTELENELEGLEDQLLQLEELRAEFRQLVLDAGGQTDADCDDFQVESGQAWGVAHNFGDVQWCFTNEGQIEDFIQNLEDYWKDAANPHLPTDEQIQLDLDLAWNEYFDKLDEYFLKLEEIDLKNQEIDQLAIDLAVCLDDLTVLQDQGLCLDHDVDGMGHTIDLVLGLEGFMPTEPEVLPEPPASPDDIIGHWAEDFINDLFGADIVSGDPDGNFRPNDPIKRAEASKVVTLAAGDETPLCDALFDVFTDVEYDAWFCAYVDASYLAGYFNGYEDGSFKPGNSILRAEAAAVVMRALGFEVSEYDTYSFPDITGDEWYADYAEKSYQCGIFSGRDGNFEGASEITRAEFAKVVNLAIFNELLESDCADYVFLPI